MEQPLLGTQKVLNSGKGNQSLFVFSLLEEKGGLWKLRS